MNDMSCSLIKLSISTDFCCNLNYNGDIYILDDLHSVVMFFPITLSLMQRREKAKGRYLLTVLYKYTDTVMSYILL